MRRTPGTRIPGRMFSKNLWKDRNHLVNIVEEWAAFQYRIAVETVILACRRVHSMPSATPGTSAICDEVRTSEISPPRSRPGRPIAHIIGSLPTLSTRTPQYIKTNNAMGSKFNIPATNSDPTPLCRRRTVSAIVVGPNPSVYRGPVAAGPYHPFNPKYGFSNVSSRRLESL